MHVDSFSLTDTPPPEGEGEFISLLFSNSDCSDGATGGGGRTAAAAAAADCCFDVAFAFDVMVTSGTLALAAVGCRPRAAAAEAAAMVAASRSFSLALADLLALASAASAMTSAMLLLKASEIELESEEEEEEAEEVMVEGATVAAGATVVLNSCRKLIDLRHSQIVYSYSGINYLSPMISKCVVSERHCGISIMLPDCWCHGQPPPIA